MFNEMRFDVGIGTVRRRDKYDREYKAVHQFAASKHSNVMFSYDTKKDAVNATEWLRKRVKAEHIPVCVSVFRLTNVIVTHK